MIEVALIKVPVSDLAVSVPFYQQALGLTAAFVAEEFGWAQLERDGFSLALYVPGRGGGERSLGGSVDFHLASRNVDGLLAAVQPLDASAAIHANADGSRSLEFTDPDGNIVKIMAAPGPA